MTLTARAAEWDHWRGPFRDGRTPEASGWNDGEWIERELWRESVGLGGSSPIIAEGHVYLLGWNDGRDTLVCLDASSGQSLWKQSYLQPKFGRHAVGDQRLYAGPSSTPEFDDTSRLIFTLGIDGDLNAWDTAADGRNVWSLNLYDRYGAERRPEVAQRRRTRRDYGYTSSPFVYGEQLIVEVGGRKGNLVAFDKRTGDELWTSENRDEAGHTGGPTPITVAGRACVAVLTLRNLVVTEIEGRNAGKTVATYSWTTDFANNIAAPAVEGDSVVITSSYNQSAMCRLQITSRGAREVWKSEGIASGVCTPIIHDGHIYWAWNGVHCVDFETGKELWKGGRIGSQGSCILTGDDRLIVFGNRGDLLLAETAERSPDRYTELASETVLSKTDAWPHVALSKGRIICRDRDGNVRCLEIGRR